MYSRCCSQLINVFTKPVSSGHPRIPKSEKRSVAYEQTTVSAQPAELRRENASDSRIGGIWGGSASHCTNHNAPGLVGGSTGVRSAHARRGDLPPQRAPAYPSPNPSGGGMFGARARRPISRAPPPALPRAPAPGLRRLRVGARHKGGGDGSSGSSEGTLEAAPPGLSGPTTLTPASGPAAHPRV